MDFPIPCHGCGTNFINLRAYDDHTFSCANPTRHSPKSLWLLNAPKRALRDARAEKRDDIKKEQRKLQFYSKNIEKKQVKK